MYALIARWIFTERSNRVTDKIQEITDSLRRELEIKLAPGVYGWTRDLADGSLEIPSLRAEHEGDGSVGKYINSLPRDRKIIVPLVTNPRLAGMLDRRGFVERERFFPEIMGGVWSTVWIRRIDKSDLT